MTSSVHQRGLAACCALAACFTAFSFRLVHLQVTEHKYYEAKAARQNVHTEPVFARRGDILDVNGIPLAQSEPVKTVVADASLVKDSGALAELLATPLRMSAASIREKLARKVSSKQNGESLPCRYIVLKKDVPELKAAEIGQLLAGAKKTGIVHAAEAIRFEQDFVRVYPNGSLLSHVLGYVDDSGTGIDGIEASMNNRLEGHNGIRYVERDRTGRELVLYRGQDNPPEDGGAVRLTIDMSLQQIVETELDIAFKALKPKKATVVMMNPKTGDIMAMANRPTFNPNPRRPDEEVKGKGAVKFVEVPMAYRRNIAITDQVEPGSTFKIVTTAAALSERLVSPDTDVFCENGYWQWCRLHDHHIYGSLTVENVLIKSSNIGIAKLGIQLGDQRFYQYARKFGFGDTTSVNLPGEIRGVVPPPDRWDKISLTRMPMGQSVAATPLQITNAMCAIANGGTLMVPQIIRDVVVNGVASSYKPQEKWRVVSKKATEQVRDALVQVVSPKGTARHAAVTGFKVAGKTGTAQKPDENGRMAHEKYVVSFAGYMPAEDPAFVMLVLFDEAQMKHEENVGGLVAAPVFSRIAEKVARYLSLEPTVEAHPPGSIFARDR